MPLFVSEESEKFLLPSCSGVILLFSEPDHLAKLILTPKDHLIPQTQFINIDIRVAKHYFFFFFNCDF